MTLDPQSAWPNPRRDLVGRKAESIHEVMIVSRRLVISRFVLIVPILAVGSCGSGSSGSPANPASPSTPQSSLGLTLNSDASSPHVAKFVAVNGVVLDFWKSGSGATVSDVRARRPDGATLEVQFDDTGRLTFLRDPEGASLRVNGHLPGGLVDITVTNKAGASWSGHVQGPVGSLVSHAARPSSQLVDGSSGTQLTGDEIRQGILRIGTFLCSDAFKTIQNFVAVITTGACLIGAGAVLTGVGAPLAIIACIGHAAVEQIIGYGVEQIACPAIAEANAAWNTPQAVRSAVLTEPQSPMPPPYSGAPTPILTARLSVNKAGTGQGTVTSSPAGITCGSDCTEDFVPGTSVTLTSQASTGSTFGGWSGDSDCSDGLVTMSAARTCTATFTLQSSGTPASDYLAYWPLDGNAADSGGGWSGSITGGVIPAPDRTGLSGRALSFDGTTGFINVGQLHPPTSGLTIAFWMKPAVSTTTTGFSLENEIVGDAGGNRGFRIHQGGNALVFQAQGGGCSASITLTPADTTRWMHVAGVYSAGQCFLYVNGQVAASGTGGTMTIGARSLQIGRDTNVATSYWGGLLDEMRLYGRALSAAEIAILAR